MNQKLLTILFRQNVDDLKMIADDFVESGEIPAAILRLALRKTEDIQFIIEQLSMQEAVDKPVVSAATECESTKEQASEGIAEFPEETGSQTVTETLPDELSSTEQESENEETEEEFIEIEEENNEVYLIENQENNKTDDRQKIEEEPENETLPEIENDLEDTIYDTKPEEENEIIETKSTDKPEENPPIITLAGKMGQILVPSRHEALYKTDNSLGNTLGNKKVDDIKQAISIGDRFRFQRELFANNGEDMNRTLNYINQLATFDEAGSFLKSKYRWTDDNETANDFMNIIKRKF